MIDDALQLPHISGVHENKKQTISRPFGVALLVAGVDDEAGPSLWCTDPSGTNTKYEAAAIGSAQEGAEALLQEKFHSNMTLTGSWNRTTPNHL